MDKSIAIPSHCNGCKELKEEMDLNKQENSQIKDDI